MAYEDIRCAFGFLNTAHMSSLKDIYCVYVILALGLVCEAGGADGDGDVPGGLNLLTIAEITGVPRETVRRKLKTLISSGLVVQEEDRTYRLVNMDIMAKVLSPLKRREPAIARAS